ncbi:hypothetical protein AU509_16220 [Lonsdalea britannica]|uniref:Nuclear transport factor 2 family protein n=1 Tax=Lonsdalea britannica TaxID=1082704 RepID=A0AAD0WJR2_9GAMM|nr:nuclear transport factor 2 family protein [Lonsdalea britannica]AXW86074.1 nuclear transport factor 2 family protein [Lonsdalea britannica]OSM94181.1 hypothetical protein AU509_16220 [Lonsdalea britannica]OSN03099.1 hypothetical protein AU510_15630 [Lonsdalea britannica]
MQEAIIARVRRWEILLRQAMLDSDVAALETLLDKELLFVTHVGKMLGRSDDLGAHRSGLIELHDLQTTDERILIKDNVVIVSVKTRISGRFNGQPSDGVFRFTRTWLLSPDLMSGRVIAATSVLLP